MRIANWEDYEIIDCGDGKKLERFGEILLIRPDPQAIWQRVCDDKVWRKAHAEYFRSKTGGGFWKCYKTIPESWKIYYKNNKFVLKPMGFKHTGIFPEQAVNWDFVQKILSPISGGFTILNLFAYTGCATVMALKSGVSVCHVDSSKGMVSWAKENVSLNNMKDRPVRFIVDDCLKFVKREIRRSKKYDGIIMDPPSYGRGPNGEIWKFEKNIQELIELSSQLLSDNAKFFLLNSYTTGVAPSVTKYLLGITLKKTFGGIVLSDEIGLKVKSTGMVLPCGNTAVWLSSNKEKGYFYDKL